MLLSPIDLPLRASPWPLFLRRSVTTDDGRRISTTRFFKPDHRAWDIAVPVGTEVVAPHGGRIVESGSSGDCGVTVVIQGAFLRSRLCHLSVATVANGQSVSKGSLVGYSGDTGHSTGPHLHWQMSPFCPSGRDCWLAPPEKWLGLSQVVVVAVAAGLVAALVRG